MAPLFSQADSNRLWRDVQYEVTLICAKSGADLFNISKVTSHKIKWLRLWPTLCMLSRANERLFSATASFVIDVLISRK